MGGAGNMLHAIKTLKANRDLLKRRIDRKKNGFTTSDTVTKVNFKKSTPEDMIVIREKIKIAKAKEQKQNIFFMGVALIIFFLILWNFVPWLF